MIFNKIKFNYNIKVLDGLFLDKKYQDIWSLLNGQKGNPYFINLLFYAIEKFLSKPENSQFYQRKFIWVSSFDSTDTDYIGEFLNFYLQKSSGYSLTSKRYPSLLEENLKKMHVDLVPKNINFDLLVNNSNLYQHVILAMENKEIVISRTSGAFFEAPKNKYFIYPSSTLCSFHILKNPYHLYSRYRLQNYTHQESLNLISGLDEKIDLSSNTNPYVLENRQSWSVNTKSWTDENVQNTYRGKIIKHEEMLNSPNDVLVSVVYHLKQAGLNTDVDFDLIDKFVENNKLNENLNFELSNQEAKQITNSLQKEILIDHNYQL